MVSLDFKSGNYHSAASDTIFKLLAIFSLYSLSRSHEGKWYIFVFRFSI